MTEESVKKVFVPILAAVGTLSFMILVGFSQKDMTGSKGQTEISVPLSIGQTNLTSYIADTELLRQKGLSGREKLSDDEAMLFIFDRPGRYGFWMKDMRFPIDIFWLTPTNFPREKSLGIDKVTLKVVDIRRNVSPATFPEVFTPTSPAKYVLETRAGFAEKNGVKIGDEISF